MLNRRKFIHIWVFVVIEWKETKHLDRFSTSQASLASFEVVSQMKARYPLPLSYTLKNIFHSTMMNQKEGLWQSLYVCMLYRGT